VWGKLWFCEGVPIDMVGGTSIGALVSALYAEEKVSPAFVAARKRPTALLFLFRLTWLWLVDPRVTRARTCPLDSHASPNAWDPS
jgi:predicted acylesterase/phospholipase RssA